MTEMTWLRKTCVVVPIDFSPESFAALDPALAFVEDSAHLHILHVLPRLSAAEPGVLWNTVDEEMRKERAANTLRKQLLQYPEVQNAPMSIAIGDPSTEIVRYARSRRAELIVMPSHGRQGINHFLKGSVAERVVRLSRCPVLVLRGSDRS